MRNESIELLKAVGAYNVAHEGDSDDDEIDAAFEMEEAALRLVRAIAASDPAVAKCFADFEAALNA
jgi:hypothetical protein